MVAPPPSRFRTPQSRSAFAPWAAMMRAELVSKARDTNVPILLAVVAAVCVLLTPPTDAAYAVITFDGMKPVMSAQTAIVAAGIVLGLMTFPIYALRLGIGCARDRRSGTGALLATSPVNSFTVVGARLAANACSMVAFSLLALCLLTVAAASRFHGFPTPASMAAYLLVVVPAGLGALLAGAFADRYLTDHDVAKSLFTILVWSTLMVCSVAASPDVFGVLLLRENAPNGANSAFSIGIVSGENLRRVAWETLTAGSSFVTERLVLVAMLVALSIVLCVLASSGLKPALSRTAVQTVGAQAGAVVVGATPRRVRPSHVGAVAAASALARHWFRGSRLIVAVSATSFLIAIIAPHSPLVSFGAALLVPLLVASRHRLADAPRLRQFERAIPGLWRPSPSIFTAFVLAASTLLPLVPALVQLPAPRSLHLVVSVILATLWLTWTCVVLRRPLLGISVYTMAWYFECFSSVPGPADLLGLHATTGLAFASALALAVWLAVTVFRKDSYAQ